MRLGDIIHKYREENDMSMGDFAKLAGVSKAYIGFLEKGINPKTGRDFAPSIKTIQSVAKAMHMDFDELFNMLDGEVSLNIAARPGSEDELAQDAFTSESGEPAANQAGDKLSPAHKKAHGLIDQMSESEAQAVLPVLEIFQARKESH